MFEQLGLDSLTPLSASALFGLSIGLVFGAVAMATRFCIRRALVGDNGVDRAASAATWLTALFVAILGTQLSVASGWIHFSDHRLHNTDLPLMLIALGGLLFGAGMVLTRGCASRITVLAASGNLRALTSLFVFVIAAHATSKGVLAPIKDSFAGFTLDSSMVSNTLQNPIAITALLVLLGITISILSVKGRAKYSHILGGASIGALVPLAWLGTGLVLQDDFDPIVFQSLAFTSTSTDTLFWLIASSSIGAGFGVGLIGGVMVGSAATAISTQQFQWVSFNSPSETGRYAAGAVLMGMGGVMAGGCTIGAGLSGISSLSLASILTLAFIALGAKVTHLGLQVSSKTYEARSISLSNQTPVAK